MCGIVGYIGKNKKAKDAVIKGLERLEYRGYDSSGIAYVNDNEVVIQKEKGRIKNLKDEINLMRKVILLLGILDGQLMVNLIKRILIHIKVEKLLLFIME